MEKTPKRLVGACASLMIAASGVALTTVPASAANATPRVVTKAEYKKIKNGMLQRKVTRTFGAKSFMYAEYSIGNHVVSAKRADTQTRTYRTKKTYDTEKFSPDLICVEVYFRKTPAGTWQVFGKATQNRAF